MATLPDLTSEQRVANVQTPAILAADSVRFAYPNGFVALGGVDLKVQMGEIVAIVGPSGCGKSTLLRLLAGLTRPSRGQLVRQLPLDRHPCSMMFQENTVLPWCKVRDNVGLHFTFTGAPRKESRHQVDRLLEMVHLDKFANSLPGELSGGMRRRVAMLTAIAPRPSLLLLDEPFSALDEPTRIGIHADVYRLVREFNITAVLVTHDLGEAITLADRVVMLSRAPATVVTQYDVPFGLERDMLQIRSEPAFLKLYGEVWDGLKEQIRPTVKDS